MNLRTYKATARKVRAAYVALQAAVATGNYRDTQATYAALDALRHAVDGLRVQVCRTCAGTGYYAKPGDPYTSWGCNHDEVPTFDVRTGTFSDEDSAA